jgi:hypothetical protein
MWVELGLIAAAEGTHQGSFCKWRFELSRRPPLVGVVETVAVVASADMQGDASGNSAEGDVASVPHHILDLHAKRGHKRLTVFRNPRLNASGCQQPPGALSGTRAVLVPRFAIGARCVLVDKEMADEGLTAINTGFGG